jgi:hypothetical protein
MPAAVCCVGRSVPITLSPWTCLPLQVTDSHDRVTLMTVLSSFCNPQLVEAPSYSLACTTTEGYTAPSHTDLKVPHLWLYLR